MATLGPRGREESGINVEAPTLFFVYVAHILMLLRIDIGVLIDFMCAPRYTHTRLLRGATKTFFFKLGGQAENLQPIIKPHKNIST